MINQVFCPKIPGKGVICSEWLSSNNSHCDRCGWNPENIDLRFKRIYDAINKTEPKKEEHKK